MSTNRIADVRTMIATATKRFDEFKARLHNAIDDGTLRHFNMRRFHTDAVELELLRMIVKAYNHGMDVTGDDYELAGEHAVESCTHHILSTVAGREDESTDYAVGARVAALSILRILQDA